jgi:oligopeptide/dipeptide ABC transporter ATP-binding protein
VILFVGTVKGREPVPVQVPVTGRWLAFNSSGERVPSHGVQSYGQSHAIDLIYDPADDSRPPLAQIPGRPPLPAEHDGGCPFRPRCAHARDVCATHPPLTQRGPSRAACWVPVEVNTPPTLPTSLSSAHRPPAWSRKIFN